ncbi:MAG: molybdopterin-dependent oxidoreductase [Halioglobus sp.]|nr:molybdopterin-dependent oxidoreductase [Halioglobus sp.]
MASKTVKTYCRFCHAYCPMEATVQGNKLIALDPDTSNAVYGGYTCIKGRQLIEQINHHTRLQQSQKKCGNGTHESIATEQALDEIAGALQNILEQYGPRSIASYNGTYSYQNSAAHDLARAFHASMNSPSYYASVTIDQPAKVAIGPARMGWWNGGVHMWNDSNVSLIIGCNTLVSHFSIPGGIPSFSPSNAMREGRKRGMKVICIDPRETEVARRADLHLQVRPGHDAALMASLINVIITEELYDKAFCEEHTTHFETLTAQVARFTPDKVAKAAGIDPQQIVEAARLFGAGPRGTAHTGTGPEMGRHPNLLQHLVQALNAICGRFCREGERMPNPGVLTADIPRLAQATGPQPQWLDGALKSRVADDVGAITVLSPYGPKAEMPTAVLSDEILTAGEGQIRALIVVGGQPLLAFPDQEKTLRALESLELLVCVDLKMSPTAKLADYVLAPKLCLEREDVTLLTDIWHDQPYSQYTKAVVEADGDKIEEWEVFWELGQRMGLQLTLDNGSALNMGKKPTKFEILKAITAGSRVPIEDIRDTDGGKVFDVPDVFVQAADPKTQERLELYPPGLEEELAAAYSDLDDAGSTEFPHLLISRRMKNTYNSTGPELSLLKAKGTTNPAFIHSSDLAALGIADGEIIRIRSAHGEIPAVAARSDDVRPGVVSMAHCWGDSPDPLVGADGKVREIGSNTNRLVNNRKDTEKYSGIPRQSCIPVAIAKPA